MNAARRVTAAVGARRITLLAGAAYLAYAIAITWPFALYPTSTLYGLVGLDLTGSIGYVTAHADALQPPFLPGNVPQLDAPAGLPTQWTLELAALPSSLLTWTLTVAIGGVAASGVFVLSNLAASAFAMFLLTRRLTGQAGPAFVAGLAFGFWPYQFAYAAQPLTSGWVLVVAFWRAMRLVEEPTPRNGAWMGAAAVLVVAWIQYWILIGAVFVTTLAVVALVLAWRRGVLARAMACWAVAAGMVGAWFAVLAAAVLLSGGTAGTAPQRDATDSVKYSARPTMFVVPSPDHPIVRDWTWDYLERTYSVTGKRETVAAYSPIYLGLTVLALALVGFITSWPRIRDLWRRTGGTAAADAAARQLGAAGLVSAAALVPVGLAWSAPPEIRILGVTVWMPAHVVLWFTTAFRSTARFAEVAMFGLCVLTAFGVAWLLRRRTARARAGITAAIAIVVGVDLWAQVPPGPGRFEYPPIAEQVAALPDGVLATYPLVPTAQWGTDELFYRPKYDKPLFNGYIRESESESAKIELGSPSSPGTPAKLRRSGVRYVLVKHYPPGSAPPGYPERGADIPGLRRLAEDEARTLYEIVAPPAPTLVRGLSGLTQPEGDLPRTLRWINEPTARIEVLGDCDPCVGRLSFGTGTFAVPRTLTVRDPSGRVLASRQIATSNERMSVPVRFRRRAVLRFEIDPAPVSPAELDPASKDTRKLGVFIAQPVRFVRGPGSVPVQQRERPN